MTKIWTINVQVDTRYALKFTGKGTWENPIGTAQYWSDHVRMTAVNDVDDKVVVGNDKDFSLSVKSEDTIRWIISEMDPLYSNHLSMCMYGFKTDNDNWKEFFHNPSIIENSMAVTATSKIGIGGAEPTGNYLKTTLADITYPQTIARAISTAGEVKYYMQFLLVDIKNPEAPQILKYLQVDPLLKLE
jgi:hypothetical protein